MPEEIRLKILEMIDSGAITAAQGLELLKAAEDEDASELALPAESPTPESAAAAGNLAGGDQPPVTPPTPQEAAPTSAETLVEDVPQAEASAPRFPTEKYRNWWQIPLWIGVGVTVISAMLMYSAFQSAPWGFWFACTWFPFALGVGIVALAFAARVAPWLHVRVRQKSGERPRNIAISLPLPLGLLRFVMRLVKGRVHGPAGMNYDEVIEALGKTSPDAPLYVEANEEDGAHVEVYIG